MKEIICPYPWDCGKNFDPLEMENNDFEFLKSAAEKRMTFMFLHCPKCERQFQFDTVQWKAEKPDVLNVSLWKKLGKPSVDHKKPPACMNMSLQDLPDEGWKPIPGFDERFLISDKGRVKRTEGWTVAGRRIFLKEQILAQFVHTDGTHQSLYTILNYKGKKTAITISKLLFYCFVREFDIFGKTFFVINNNDPFWNLDHSKLSLHSIHSVLKGKI